MAQANDTGLLYARSDRQTLPLPSKIPKGVKRKSMQLSNDVFESYELLHAIIQRHEDVLRKRWMKRSRGARKTLLLDVWPAIPHRHRPDFHVICEQLQKEEDEEDSTRLRHIFLMPYINLEDLIQPRPLLLLLDSRGRNLPSTFASINREAFRLGLTSGNLRREVSLDHCVMLLTGETTRQTYGKLVSWGNADLSDVVEWFRFGMQFKPGDGLLVLEAQKELLQFLVGCCKELLRDKPFLSLTGSGILTRPEPAPLVATDLAYSSIFALAMDAPYGIPAELNFTHLRILADARSMAANDHILAMREDPGYFAYLVRDYSEHRHEQILDAKGRPGPDLATDRFWDYVVGQTVNNAYLSKIIWDLLSKYTSTLEMLQTEYGERILPGQRLPSDYLCAFFKLRAFLRFVPNNLMPIIRGGYTSSPGFRSSYISKQRRSKTGPGHYKIKDSKKDDKLINVLALLLDARMITRVRLYNIMDQVEWLIQFNANDKQRISGLVGEWFADLALVARMQNQVDLYEPRHSDICFKTKEHEEALKEDRAEWAPIVASIGDFVQNSCPPARSVTPLRQKLHYPVDKPRTKQTTDAMRAAERNLDQFWLMFDRLIVESCQQTGCKWIFPGGVEVQRTAEWVEPIKAVKKPIDKNTQNQLVDPFSRLATETRSLKASAFEPARPRHKPKTRGSAQDPDQDPAEEADPSAETTPETRKLAVTKRALKVFSTIFHRPNQTDMPGEIAWTEFLHAMSSAGFAIEKQYGSVWQFTPSLSASDSNGNGNGDGERAESPMVKHSIQFHEPHPSGKIPFWTARRHGRRLFRTYGWTGESFVLA